MSWNGMGGMGGMMVFGVLMMVVGLVVLVAIILLVVWGATQLPNRTNSRSPAAARGEDPLTVLQRRYAAGEIAHEDYDRIRRELSGSTH